MTNTEKPQTVALRSLRIDSGVLSTGNIGEPKKVSLRIEVPDVGTVSVQLTGDQVLAMLTGSTFEQKGRWLPEDPADEARLVAERWVTRDAAGDVAEWPTEEKARAYACARQVDGKTERVFHREVWERRA